MHLMYYTGADGKRVYTLKVRFSSTDRLETSVLFRGL